jgi:hypothetical protein
MPRQRARAEVREEEIPPQQGPKPLSYHMRKLMPTEAWQSAVRMYNDWLAERESKARGGRPPKAGVPRKYVVRALRK